MEYTILDQIAKKYGNNFYLFDREKLVSNYLRFKSSFGKYYDNFVLAYAYKANYAPFVIKMINKLGGISEVVSEMEYQIAIAQGVKGEDIIFNGPFKTAKDIKESIFNNSLLNIDSFYELEILKKICEEDSRFNALSKGIGIRMNFRLSNKLPSRFGFTEDHLSMILEIIKSIPNTWIKGIHCHFSTRDKSLENYIYISEKMSQIYIKLSSIYPLEFIDIGGGYFGDMPEELKKNFGVKIPKIEEYAEAITGVFNKNFDQKKKPKLIIEPGISIVGDSMEYYTRILEIKNIDGTYNANTSGSKLHVQPAGGESVQPFSVISDKNTKTKDELYYITGNTCMEHDILFKKYYGCLKIGDFLCFPNKGAYTNVFTPPFIHYSPPILEYTDRQINVLKRQDTIEDILSTYY